LFVREEGVKGEAWNCEKDQPSGRVLEVVGGRGREKERPGRVDLVWGAKQHRKGNESRTLTRGNYMQRRKARSWGKVAHLGRPAYYKDFIIKTRKRI